MNIVTACQGALIKMIGVQLEAIHENIGETVEFYLLHCGDEPDLVTGLELQCEAYENLRFHSVLIEDIEPYRIMAQSGGEWPPAAYFSFGAHLFLPEDADRALYLDAGDTLVIGDPSDYYYSDFEGSSLIVTAKMFKDGKNLYYEEDLTDLESLAVILRGLFNSGSYVINLAKLRRQGLQLEDVAEYVKGLETIFGTGEKIYFGDQGLLSAVFLGDMKYYRYPEIIDSNFTPYNFNIGYLDVNRKEPEYDVKIIHYVGGPKPWKADLDLSDGQGYMQYKMSTGEEMSVLSRLLIKYYGYWYHYSRKI